MNALAVKLFFSFCISFLITFYLIPIFCIIAQRLQFVDVPDGRIKRHEKSTPYLGGMAIYCGFLCTLAFVLPFGNQMGLLLIGTTLLLFLGLIDDFIVLMPYQKFFGQIIATFCLLKSGFYLKEHFFYNIWNIPLSFFWFLSIINAFNLIDVMDGLTAVISFSITLTLFLVALYLQHTVLTILLMAFLGTICAFFWFNRPTARIYLGDAGSLFIGGFLAAIPFLINWGTYSLYGYLAPIIIFAIPLLEMVTLIVVRTYKGIPFYKGSPDHFSIYLQQNGWSKSAILIYIFFLSLILFMVSNLLIFDYISLNMTVAVAVLFVFFWIFTLTIKSK